MEVEWLIFENKRIRAEVIRRYLSGRHNKKVVCFSCGNASRELTAAGLEVIDVSPSGVLTANRWLTQQEISEMFPQCFDATSGHLPFELMLKIAEAFKQTLGVLKGRRYLVPTGSGETIVCLKLAYPDTEFVAVYNMGKPTEYCKDAPLNKLVQVISAEVKGL